jgi:hypothetical protein
MPAALPRASSTCRQARRGSEQPPAACRLLNCSVVERPTDRLQDRRTVIPVHWHHEEIGETQPAGRGGGEDRRSKATPSSGPSPVAAQTASCTMYQLPPLVQSISQSRQRVCMSRSITGPAFGTRSRARFSRPRSSFASISRACLLPWLLARFAMPAPGFLTGVHGERLHTGAPDRGCQFAFEAGDNRALMHGQPRPHCGATNLISIDRDR